MTIQSERVGKSGLILCLSGRLDTATAPQLERKIKQWGDEIDDLVLDFLDLTYVSSMGLRVLLQTQKNMSKTGRKLTIRNMNESIREVFEMTGFINLMVQEEKFVVIKKEEGDRITLAMLGQMDIANVPTVSAELTQIMEQRQAGDETVTLILDMTKLSALSNVACKLLKESLEKTEWPRRVVSITNTSEKVRKEIEGAAMGGWLDPRPEPQGES